MILLQKKNYCKQGKRNLPFSHFYVNSIWPLNTHRINIIITGMKKKLSFPFTPEILVEDLLHGIRITDNYRWLEDQNSPETRTFIEKQTEYARNILDSYPDKEEIRNLFLSLQRFETATLPEFHNGYYYYMKRPADADRYRIIRKNSCTGNEEIIADPSDFGDDSVSFGYFRLNQKGTVMAFSLRKGGADEVEFLFYDLLKNCLLPDKMPVDRYFGFEFVPESHDLIYSSASRKGVFYHTSGTDFSEDQKMFGDGYDNQWLIGCFIPRKSNILIISAFHGSSGTRTDVFMGKLCKNTAVTPLITGKKGNFSISYQSGKIYALTNYLADRYRLIEIDPENPQENCWNEVISASEDILCDVEITDRNIFTVYQKNVSARIRMFDRQAEFIREIPLPGHGSADGLKYISETDELFYAFSSFTSPPVIIRYNTEKESCDLFSGSDRHHLTDEMEVNQVFYRSIDQTEIPMYIISSKDLKKDGTAPAILYGYGGFNHSLTPFYNLMAIFMASQGGVFAIANLRGGGEFGESWHQAGMFEKKQNVFDDFHAAAEWLISEKYTSSEKLVAYGGSNGGLLVGAALTQRPELFHGIICTYPLLDMIRFHRFLVGSYWITEYGSADEASQFEYLIKYSPYHNVRNRTCYPAVMFITGDLDTRVDPCHARKMTALLQASTASELPVILRYDVKAGHSRGQSVSKQAEVDTDIVNFLRATAVLDFSLKEIRK